MVASTTAWPDLPTSDAAGAGVVTDVSGTVVAVVGAPGAPERSAGAPPSRDDHDATLPLPYSRSTATSLGVPTGGAFHGRSTVVSRLAARSDANGNVCG